MVTRDVDVADVTGAVEVEEKEEVEKEEEVVEKKEEACLVGWVV